MVILVLFVMQERQADGPTISFELCRVRPVAVANGTVLLTGMVLSGIATRSCRCTGRSGSGDPLAPRSSR